MEQKQMASSMNGKLHEDSTGFLEGSTSTALCMTFGDDMLQSNVVSKIQYSGSI